MLSLPLNGATEVDLTALLETDAYSDPQGKPHVKTHWQISKDQPIFSEDNLVADEVSDSSLTSWTVPPLVLDIETQYFWRVNFYNGECWSQFSEVFVFVTTDDGSVYIDGVASEDIIPTGEVRLGDEFVDDNGDPVNTPTTKAFNLMDCQVGLVAVNATIEKCGSVDPQHFEDGDQETDDVPNFECGMVELELKVANKGDVAYVTYYFTQKVPKNFIWWKYDPNVGFIDYELLTDNRVVSVSDDRKSVTVMFKDGGYGDLIEAPDAKIIDPAGAGGVSSSGGGSSDNCFITSAGNGSAAFVTVIILMLSLFGVGYSAVAVRKNR